MIKLHYEMFYDPLEKQANRYGLTFGDNAEFIEELREGFNTIRLYLFDTWQDERKAEHKLNDKAMSLLKPMEGENG